MKIEKIFFERRLGGRNGSFAHLILRRFADIYLLLSRKEMLHDDGELYVLDEVYGKVFKLILVNFKTLTCYSLIIFLLPN